MHVFLLYRSDVFFGHNEVLLVIHFLENKHFLTDSYFRYAYLF